MLQLIEYERKFPEFGGDWTYLEVAGCLDLLGDANRARGQAFDYKRAEAFLQRSLAIREEVLGKKHPDVADSLHTLANLYSSQGDHTQATMLRQRALAVQNEARDETQPDVAPARRHLAFLEAGRMRREAWRYSYPLQHLERTRELRKIIQGWVPLEVASCLTLIGNAYRQQRWGAFGFKYKRAERLLQRSLELREESFGKNHPGIAIALHDLASFYQDDGQHEQARLLYARALAIREEALGKSHPDVAISLHSLARLYTEQGNYTRAEPLYERALAIREEALGKNHPDVATLLHSL